MITKKVKIAVIAGVAMLGLAGLLFDAPKASMLSAGPPAGFSSAPDESNCAACHSTDPHTGGTFAIIAPAKYFPGRTYHVTVQHQSPDTTRKRWGYELLALAGTNNAGSFTNLSANTQIITENGRQYSEHTSQGTFAGQTGGATWQVDWTAPASNVGSIKLYASGNQANNGTGPNGDQIYDTSATILPLEIPFDFDGDGKTDIGIYRPVGVNGAEWWISKSSNDGVFATQFGAATDSVVAADYTGDGKADVAFWRPSTGYWYVLRSEDMTYYATPFGASGDVPVPADYDADGKADTAVFRPSNSTWYINNTTGGTTITGFGAAGDKPVAADYDGDGKADIAVFRPNGANGAEWWIRKSSDNSVFATQFGSSTDKAVPADYTGDGKADIAFWTSGGTWYILRSEDLTYYADQFGTTGDVPSPGDYDGDGKADAAVFRPTGSTWYVKRSTAGLLIKQFGSTGDIPVPSIFVR